MLASVSKNRQLSLYFRWSYIEKNLKKFNNEEVNKNVSDFLERNKKMVDPENLRSKDFYYIPMLTQEVHSKLIFSVSVSQDCKFVATGSRDRKIKVFSVFEGGSLGLKEIYMKKMKNSIRAVEFLQGQSRFLVVGLDNGEVHLLDLEGNHSC
jgi:WD40 repeat protein